VNDDKANADEVSDDGEESSFNRKKMNMDEEDSEDRNQFIK
jgi:hypothetical protein